MFASRNELRDQIRGLQTDSPALTLDGLTQAGVLLPAYRGRVNTLANVESYMLSATATRHKIARTNIPELASDDYFLFGNTDWNQNLRSAVARLADTGDQFLGVTKRWASTTAIDFTLGAIAATGIAFSLLDDQTAGYIAGFTALGFAGRAVVHKLIPGSNSQNVARVFGRTVLPLALTADAGLIVHGLFEANLSIVNMLEPMGFLGQIGLGAAGLLALKRPLFKNLSALTKSYGGKIGPGKLSLEQLQVFMTNNTILSDMAYLAVPVSISAASLWTIRPICLQRPWRPRRWE
jgi:hypothetical protein